MTAKAFANDMACRDIEWGEQGGDAMASTVVGAMFDMPAWEVTDGCYRERLARSIQLSTIHVLTLDVWARRSSSV
jgi:hypothetical protein